jgi:hypothetical protein
MLGRVLGFCAVVQRASIITVSWSQRTGHCDGFVCRIVRVVFVEAGRQSSILQESVARLQAETALAAPGLVQNQNSTMSRRRFCTVLCHIDADISFTARLLFPNPCCKPLPVNQCANSPTSMFPMTTFSTRRWYQRFSRNYVITFCIHVELRGPEASLSIKATFFFRKQKEQVKHGLWRPKHPIPKTPA